MIDFNLGRCLVSAPKISLSFSLDIIDAIRVGLECSSCLEMQGGVGVMMEVC